MDNRLTDTKTAIRFWPTPQDYCEAMQTPELSFQVDSLRKAKPELDALGMPRPISGGFASVYKLAGKEMYAVRCFLSNRPDQQERYKKISEFVLSDNLSCTLDFEYIEQGVKIAGNWFPILRMPWVTGDTLDRYVMKHWKDQRKMEDLCEAYRQMDRELRKSGIAHGDLQHGNILVMENGALRLVDYDGMFVPSMKGWNAIESGHTNYQHPGRREIHFDHRLDNFSSLVIYASLRAIAIDPGIVNKTDSMAENLLLRNTDFQQPTSSPMFKKLDEHKSSEVRLLSQLVRHYLDESPLAVPPLDDLPEKLPRQLPPIVVNPGNRKSSDQTAKLSDDGRGVHEEKHQGQNDDEPWWVGQISQATLLQQKQAVPQLAPIPPGVEPELAQLAPRPIKYNIRQNRFPPWVKQVALCLSPPVWFFVFFPLFCSATLTSTEADVIGIARPDSDGYTHKGKIFYTFTPQGGEQGEEQTGIQYLPEGSPLQRSAEQTAKIRVSYSPMFPWLGASATGDPCPVPLPLAGLALVVLAALSVWIWYTPRKQKRLARHGLPVRGKIVDKREMVAPRSPTRYELRYEYHVNLRRYEGTMAVADIDYMRTYPGNEVTVLYNPKNPYESVVYKFAYYIVKS